MNTSGNREYSREKLKELMLYIAGKSGKDVRYGSTKLNKILFYSDFLAYGLLGQSLTGAKYQRLDKGPAPKALVPVRNELIAEGAATTEDRLYFNWPQIRLVPERPPDLKLFTKEELELVDQVIEWLKDNNGNDVSRISHREKGWNLAEDRADIPYSTVFLSNRKLTKSEIAHFQKVSEKQGWLVHDIAS